VSNLDWRVDAHGEQVTLRLMEGSRHATLRPRFTKSRAMHLTRIMAAGRMKKAGAKDALAS
jgi:hypothetical protein